MTIYLQTDGVDDYIKTPSITIDSITMDCLVAIDSNQSQLASNPFLLDARFGGKYFKYNNTGGYVTTTGITSVNGLAKGTRISITFNFTSMTNVVYFFSANTGSLNVKGNIYKITCSLGGVTKAVYDMSTGTVQDQSGNGNHATLNGGTWLDDGTGGSTGTDGSVTLGLTQQIYSDSSINLGLTQQIYNDSSVNLSLSQAIYKDTEAVLDLTQAIYRELENSLNLRQEIYADGQALLNLIQEFYEDSQTFITLQLIQEIYRDSSSELPLTQAIYKDTEINLPLRQEMYEEKETVLPMSQTIYKDGSEVLALTQTIYRDAFQVLSLAQQMYVEGEISLPLFIQIRDDMVQIISTIHLKGKQELNVYLKGEQELNVHLQGRRELHVNLKGLIQ